MSTCIKEQCGLDDLTEYVPGKHIEEVQREYGIKEVIKLASNENPFGTSPRALEAMKEALCSLNRYPDGGSICLREALAEKHGFPIEQVTVGNGADGIIMEVCMSFLDQESEVVTSESSFPIYDNYTKLMRANMIKTPLKNYSFDLEKMAGELNVNTRVIFLCNPNNPTGTIVHETEVRNFLKNIPENVLVVFDEAYFEYVDSDEYPDGLNYLNEGLKNVLVMRTFSKVYGLAGIRVGYAITTPEIISALHKVKEAFAVNTLAQAAGIAALEDNDFLDEVIEKNRIGRLFFYSQFTRMGLFYLESHANFVLVKVGPDAGAIQLKMLEKGIIVRPCTGYELPEFLRVSVGNEKDNLRLIEVLESLL